MKTFIFCLLLLGSSYTSYSQSAGDPTVDSVYKYPKQQASFNGELSYWLRDHLKYPENAMAKNIQGKVYLQFIVRENGNITDITILKTSGSPDIDAEGLRVVKLMPTWIPAKNNGKAVASYFTLPLNFTLR